MRIDAFIGFCRMRRRAGDDDVERIAGQRVGAGADRDLAGRRVGIDMNADRGVDIVEQPLLDHPPAAERLVLLGRLEDEAHGAAKDCRADRCRCAATANPIDAWASWPQACITPGLCRGKLDAGLFLDRQGVDVGANGNLSIRRLAGADDVDGQTEARDVANVGDTFPRRQHLAADNAACCASRFESSGWRCRWRRISIIRSRMPASISAAPDRDTAGRGRPVRI